MQLTSPLWVSMWNAGALRKFAAEDSEMYSSCSRQCLSAPGLCADIFFGAPGDQAHEPLRRLWWCAQNVIPIAALSSLAAATGQPPWYTKVASFSTAKRNARVLWHCKQVCDIGYGHCWSAEITQQQERFAEFGFKDDLTEQLEEEGRMLEPGRVAE